MAATSTAEKGHWAYGCEDIPLFNNKLEQLKQALHNKSNIWAYLSTASIMDCILDRVIHTYIHSFTQRELKALTFETAIFLLIMKKSTNSLSILGMRKFYWIIYVFMSGRFLNIHPFIIRVIFSHTQYSKVRFLWLTFIRCAIDEQEWGKEEEEHEDEENAHKGQLVHNICLDKYFYFETRLYSR